MQQGRGATLLDLVALKAAQQTGFPYMYLQTQRACLGFCILLRTLLPDEHPLNGAWDQFTSTWDKHSASIEHKLHHTDYALVLRWLQLRLLTWFTGQVRLPGLFPVPEFATLVTDIL